ncbi:hypothetical protein GW796_05445 [archaeon]|nr:hypothetical protein [archaeon]NCQ51328.1 hypothetical protein [archaeon]NCT58846.1 hypothetical protein [archaeon]
MKTFKEYIKFGKIEGYLSEAAYDSNLGAVEMIAFFQKASPDEIEKMEKIVKNENWDDFKKLIKKVLNVQLH